MENRLAELESRIAFQDKTLNELNDVIIRQQRQIDQMSKGLAELQAQVKSLAPAMVAPSTEETPPPHY